MIGPDSVLRFREFEFSARQMELRKRGHRIRISASQLRLLILFLERQGELVTRDDVVNRLWTDTATIDTISGVNTAINRLRFHLGDDANAPLFLETVIGVGYRFIAPVEDVQPVPMVEASEATSPEPSPSLPEFPAAVESAVPVPAEQARSSSRLRSLLAVAAVVLLLIAAAGWTFVRHSQRRSVEAAHAAVHFARVTSDFGGQQVTAAALSQDGKLLAYADGSGVRVRDLTTGLETTLGTLPTFVATGLSWFPGNGQIAVSGTDLDKHRNLVWMVSIQGVGAIVLANDADSAVVSPDGQLIAVLRSDRREIDLIRQDGGAVRKLAQADAQRAFSSLCWSPDGLRLIAISHNPPFVDAAEPGLWLYESIRASDGTVLAREPDVAIRSAALLPGGRLQYVGDSSGKTIAARSVFSVRTDSATGRFLGTPEEIGHLDAAALAGLSASSDGSRLAVIAHVPAADVFNATLQRDATGFPTAFQNLHRVTSSSSDAYPHAWTPDRSIVYESDSKGHLAVIAQRPDEIIPRVLGQFPFHAVMAQVSPDQRFILFLRLRSNGQTESIYRMPIEGGEAQKIPGTDGADEFRCALTTRVPCVMRRRIGAERQYFALDPVSGVGRLLARSPWQPSRRGDWGVSPDGSMVVVANHDSKNPSLNFLPLNGASEFTRSVVIHGHGSPLGASWDVDGKSLFVETRNSDNFELLSVTLDGHAQLLRKSDSVIWVVSSPDGRSIAFPDPTQNSNVWVSGATP